MPVSFDTTQAERDLIKKIAARAVTIAKERFIKYSKQDCSMDITACHCNGNPLDLRKLLDADDFNFSHDVFGIARHIDRETGKLSNHFSPRCSIWASDMRKWKRQRKAALAKEAEVAA